MDPLTHRLLEFVKRLKTVSDIPDRLKEIHQGIEQQTEAIRTNNGRSNREEYPQPFRVEVDFSETQQCKNNSESKRQYCIQKSLRDWTKFAFFAAAIYAGISGYQGCQMKRSTDMLVKQLEATQAAMVNIFEPSLSDPYPDGVTRHIGIHIKNTGRGIAHRVTADIRIVSKTLPGERMVGNPIEWKICLGEMVPTPEPDRGISRELVIEITPSKASQMDAVKEGIWIEGVIWFDNGFRAGLIPQPVCYAVVSIPPNTIASRGANFQECDSTRVAVQDALRWQLKQQAP